MSNFTLKFRYICVVNRQSLFFQSSVHFQEILAGAITLSLCLDFQLVVLVILFRLTANLTLQISMIAQVLAVLCSSGSYRNQ